MKIGILTFTDGTNLGQRLQNYALQTLLEEHGCHAYTIRQSHPSPLIKRLLKSSRDCALHHSRFVAERKRESNFEAFNNQFIRFYEKTLNFKNPNSSICNDFDAFIVGSDQIWNPMSPFVGDNFFLRFAPYEKRLTYAPSFSVENIPEKFMYQYRKRLEGFRYLSVREHRGAQIIQTITGRNATVVLDPTLMINRKHWEGVSTPYGQAPDKPFILSMFLGGKPSTSVHEISEHLHLSVFSIDSLTNINPSQFLGALRQASLVLTDSYHVTIFSILFNVPFVNFNRTGSLNMNSRFETLYQNLGINRRFWGTFELGDIMSVDFDTIREHLECKRKESSLFLETELKWVTQTLKSKTKD
ncbi:polysaccharide pyruvyl transferase family protein [Bifidobacterium felsineum]|uniref:polysaccharide pyruvyl transferase family protein n=1 Tax=Bifidobacterium felsineum TaxID=2045440 RepID=UPI001BDCAD1D|nr:polysaccharide pyruvyl transferase family protein [Bifidobacterium felsineum]MBT1165074.1 polysaccharide pyruvyl transferase family protein [Bifidobacterium felsineum]